MCTMSTNLYNEQYGAVQHVVHHGTLHQLCMCDMSWHEKEHFCTSPPLYISTCIPLQQPSAAGVGTQQRWSGSCGHTSSVHSEGIDQRFVKRY